MNWEISDKAIAEIQACAKEQKKEAFLEEYDISGCRLVLAGILEAMRKEGIDELRLNFELGSVLLSDK